MCAPSQCVRNGGVVNLHFGFGVEVERDERVVEEASHNVVTVGRGGAAHNEGLLSEERLRLVGFSDTNTDFTLGCADD